MSENIVLHGLKRFFKKFTSGNKDIAQFIQIFTSILNELGIIKPLQQQLIDKFIYNIESQQKVINQEDLSSIIWMTLYSEIELHTIYETNIFQKIIVFGQGGCGKTTFISQMLNAYAETQFYISTNEASKKLLQQYNNNCQYFDMNSIQNFDNNIIFETKSISELNQIITQNINGKIYLCIDSQNDYDYLLGLKETLIKYGINNVDYIVITKIDCTKLYGIIFNATYLFNAKIINFTNQEISKQANQLIPGTFAINLLSETLLKQTINDQEDIKSVFSDHAKMLNFNTYKIYIQLIQNTDAIKFNSLINVLDVTWQKLSDNSQEYNRSIIDKLKTTKIRDNIKQNLKIQLYIIDSMRAIERQYPSIINESRIIRIAKGSGTSPEAVEATLNGYQQFQQIMSTLDYKKILENLT